ncbi:MAG: hypothetical protein ISS26_02265 [Candidatus Omnitrophica bacterium]|nr:hypothetical protein [Candidatus Omnitrophota bacterium]
MIMNRFCVLLFVLLFAVSGCGKKAEVEQPISEPETAQSSQVETPKAPPAIPSKPMVESEKAAVSDDALIVADFEGWPNNLGGEIGVYGALEPDWENVNEFPVSWVYDPVSLGYNTANVRSGNNSFRLVNGLGVKPELAWGSFAMDLGSTIDITTTPKKVESLDASGYKFIVFWAKGESGGEKMELLVRDGHALDYDPQIRYRLPDLTAQWQRIMIPLAQISGKVDLSQLDNLGIAFGKDVGNMQGDIAYIDDFIFTNNAE